MTKLSIDISAALQFCNEKELTTLENSLIKCHQQVISKTGKGNDFLGWVDLPKNIEESLIKDIENTAALIKKKAEIFVVIGIGGSYLGARAVIEALNHNFDSLRQERKAPLIVYAGQNISEDYLSDLLEVLDKRDYALTVISKSGTTTEPAIAFRILRNHLEQKYGIEEARERIIAITDAEKGALKKLATQEGYKTYNIPDDVGGRYSVLTPVGLLPIAVAGFDIRKLIKGAIDMREECLASSNIKNNKASMYAAIRNTLYNDGKKVELMVNYQPSLFYITEWWKQLYGESEGKENKGIFPAGVGFTTDLHSMGQYIQEGERHIFETVISIESPKKKLLIPSCESDGDGLNFLAGMSLHEVNHKAELGTMLAHVDGGVPNIKISIPSINEETIGELLYFFEFGCALSGYLLDVNPFDQPGVEEYKRNMFALLDKPGFEQQTAELKERLSSKK